MNQLNWFDGSQIEKRHLEYGVSLVLGNQWGDEGKGKITDILTQKSDVIIRFQGGHNAGHTVTLGNQSFDLHILPSGVLTPGKINIITRGCVLGIDLNKIDLDTLQETQDGLICNSSLDTILKKDNTSKEVIRVGMIPELEKLEKGGIDTSKSGLKISGETVVIGMHNVLLDAFDERARVVAGLHPIGSTGSGISRAYASEIQRLHFTVNDLLYRPETFYQSIKSLWLGYQHNFPNISPDDLIAQAQKERKKLFEYIQQGKIEIIGNEIQYIKRLHKLGKKIVGEGAQASMIGSANSFFGTASDPSLQSFLRTTGLTVGKVGNIFLVHKLPPSSVGTRPQYLQFDPSPELDAYRKKYQEFGASTGRPRDLWHHPIYEAARGTWLNVRGIDDESKIVPVYNRVDGLKDSLALDNGKLRAALGYSYEVKNLVSGIAESVLVGATGDELIQPETLLSHYPEKSGQVDLFDITKDAVHFVELQGDLDSQIEQLLGLYNAAIFREDKERDFLIGTGPKREDLELKSGFPKRKT